MDLHQNARLTFRSRETLAHKIMIEKVTLKAAAAAFNVSRKTAAKRVRRYRGLGLAGLRYRCSRPFHSPRRTSSELIAQVIALRRQLRPAYQIALATRLNYLNSEERDQQPLPWLEHYNFHRPHGSLGYAPPISRAAPAGTTS